MAKRRQILCKNDENLSGLFGRLSWGTLATKNAGWNTLAGIDFSQSIYEKLAIDPRIDTGPTNRWKSTLGNK